MIGPQPLSPATSRRQLVSTSGAERRHAAQPGHHHSPIRARHLVTVSIRQTATASRASREPLGGEVEILERVRRRHLRADARRPARDDREREADRVDAELDELARERARRRPRRRSSPARSDARRGGRRTPSSVIRERKWAVFSRSRSRSSCEPSISSSARRLAADDRRREAVREQVRPRALAQQLDDLAPAGDVAAARAADRLAERAGEDVDALDDAVMLGRAAAARADDADRVRVVDHHERVVALGEVADPVEPREVAVHREDAVGRDQPVARAGRLVRAAPRARPCRRSRSGAAAPCTGGSPSMIDAWLSWSEMTASCSPSSASNRPPLASKHELKRIVSSVPRNDDEALLELAVQRLRAADEAHRRHAVAPAVERLVRRLDDRRVAREPEIVVRAEVEQLAAPSTSTCAPCGVVITSSRLVEARLADLGERRGPARLAECRTRRPPSLQCPSSRG